MGRFSTVVLSVVTLAAACCAVVTGTALPASASPQAAGTWGTAQEVPGLAALNSGGSAAVDSVSCGSAGNCAAAGTYTDSAGHQQAFVVDEVNGSWDTAQEVPGLAALNAGGNASVASVSCPSAGNCTVGGTYMDSAVDEQAFVVDETGGSWGMAQQVPGLAALSTGVYPDLAFGIISEINLLSCGSAGNCAAVGVYADSAGDLQTFVVNETGGSWDTAQLLPGPAGAGVSVSSLSCPSAGNCAAAGGYGDPSRHLQAFVVDETGGTWGTAEEVPGLAALEDGGSADIYSVSCASAGNCAAGGWYLPSNSYGKVFVADEVNGSWGTAEEIPGTAALNAPGPTSYGDIAGSIAVDSVSCPSPGNCTAVGQTSWASIFPAGAKPEVFVVNETGGSWGTAEVLAGVAGGEVMTFTGIEVSVSCGSAGNCVAGGVDGDVRWPTPFLAEETGGSWGTAHEPPGLAALNAWVSSVSCASAGNCAAGGSYKDSSAHDQAFVVDEKPSTSTVLSLSAAKVTYGKEQAERVSVAVSAPSGGTPSGTVTVQAGTAVLCGNLTLASGLASCTVPATRLPAGTWHLTASYGGSAGLAASTSAARTLTVAKAASKITLSLSAARVTYGKEQAERLTVRVTPQYGGMPAGKVTVKSGSTTVCTITLASGRGTCTLAARKLPAGTRTLIAVNPGNGDFTGAASAPKTLKVVK